MSCEKQELLCEHLGSFPVFWWIRVAHPLRAPGSFSVFWWIRVAHPLRAPGFIPDVLVDPCCSSFASTWVHSRCFFWIRVAHPLSFLCYMYLFCTPSFCVLFRILPVSVDSHYLFGPSDFSNVYLLLDAIRMMSVLY